MTLEIIAKEQTENLDAPLSLEPGPELKEYHVFNNLVIKTDTGWARVDYIIVSKYGIFVVESKSRTGKINGNGDETEWTEVMYRNRLKFQNPVKQTCLNIKSLSDFLNINPELVQPVIVFREDCQFKAIMPDNVLSSIQAQYVSDKAHLMLSDEEIERICQELNLLKANISLLKAWRRIKALKERYPNSRASNRPGRVLT